MENVDSEGYTSGQRQTLELAKKTHRDTTASAQRALQARCLGTLVRLVSGRGALLIGLMSESGEEIYDVFLNSAVASTCSTVP